MLESFARLVINRNLINKVSARSNYNWNFNDRPNSIKLSRSYAIKNAALGNLIKSKSRGHVYGECRYASSIHYYFIWLARCCEHKTTLNYNNVPFWYVAFSQFRFTNKYLFQPNSIFRSNWIDNSDDSNFNLGAYFGLESFNEIINSEFYFICF